MFPEVDNVTLVPPEEMARRFAGMQIASTNQMMHQYLLEPLVEWARQRTDDPNPVEVPAIVQTITIMMSDYARQIGPPGHSSLNLLLPHLLSDIVRAMIDDEHERLAVQKGLYAAFAQYIPPDA